MATRRGAGRVVGAAAIAAGIFWCFALQFAMQTAPWRIVADEVATCNCAWGCPCQFNALPTYGRCEALVAVHIRQGHYGSDAAGWSDVCDGVLVARRDTRRKGIAQLAIDERATPEQRTAF